VSCHAWGITSNNLGHCWTNFILGRKYLVLRCQRVHIWINILMCSIRSLAIWNKLIWILMTKT
jgi:hypothetical protein